VQNRDALHAEIERVFGALTSAQVEQRLEAAGIANARLNTLQAFWDHPQLAARDRWREVGTPAGAVRAPLPPFNLSEFEPRMDEVPALGAHSRKVLAELGFGEAELERLAAAGAIRSS
jgi:itaconate CoA-transferase